METPPASFWARNQFLIRRLHSLSGLIPVGAYLCVHLATNASIWGGGEVYQASVDRIHALGPLLPLVEWTFIFLPLLFHALIGFVIIGGALPNTTDYPYARNIRYTLQRATGIVAFAFIVWHVLQMHYLGAPLKRVNPELFASFDPHEAAPTAAAALQYSLLIQIVYAVGILASVYHLANGLWTMGITWGVWTSPQAQRRADYVCSAFGVALAAVGIGAMFGFTRYLHAPIVDLDGSQSPTRNVRITTAAGPSPLPLARPDAMLTDLDSKTLAGLVVKIANPWDGLAEQLAADTEGTKIEASFAADTLVLSGSDTVENYQKVLRTITYRNTAATPNPADRRILFRASDGQQASATALAILSSAESTGVIGQAVADAAQDR